MTEQHFVLKPDGKIGWIEKMPPELPKLETKNFHEFKYYNEAVTANLNNYNSALQSAIDNAVEVSNQKEVIDEFFHSAILPKDEHGRKEWKIKTIQSIQCSVHVYETNAVRKRLALVTFSQPDTETVEETQEELKRDFVNFLTHIQTYPVQLTSGLRAEIENYKTKLLK